MVRVAHPLCKEDEWQRKHQGRLSFSRAEIALLNSWLPEQQIVYHMLRYFMKNTQLTDSANDSGAGTLSNYHIKTLMLWSCELKPRSWWTDDFNLIRICVELLHTLADWLNDGRCPHYFISNCNLIQQFVNMYDTQVTANKLMSVTRQWLCEWYVDNYIQKCADERCPDSLLTSLWHPISSEPRGGLDSVVCLQKMVSAVVKIRQDLSPWRTSYNCQMFRNHIIADVSLHSLTLQTCLCWMHQLANADQVLSLFFTAMVSLHVAHKTMQGSLTDEMLDVLAALTYLQLNDVRRCVNARHSSLLSLNQAAVLMKVVANNSRSTVQLIQIELSKAYLHRALRCKDSDRYSIYCLANVYLAVLYYTTGQCDTAIDHCTLVTRSQDHSQCSSHVIQGELLPKIDDQVDSILGLAVFYQYIRAATLNEEQERRHVSVFTTELFAHYLYTKFLSATECQQLPQSSLAEQIRRYRSCVCNSREMFVTDVIAFILASRTRYTATDRELMTDRVKTKSLVIRQLDTSKLVELLQQSAVEYLTTCRELEAPICDSLFHVITTDFKALYAYKCGQYQRCLQLSVRNVRTLISRQMLGVLVYVCPELIQLMDDDIVSLIGLTVLANPPHNKSIFRCAISQLSLSLYLMTQCQIKLRHSVTSLDKTLDDVEFSRTNIVHGCEFDQLVLKFVTKKISR